MIDDTRAEIFPTDQFTLDQLESITIISHSPEETQTIGRTLGAHASPGDVYLLVGGLGSGKTCLTQGILWGLGVDEYARSPTFVLVSQYQGRLALYHMDFYRLDSIEEIGDLGLDEYLLGDGVSVVEWAEKGRELFPTQHMTINIEYLDESTRRMTLSASGDRYADTLDAVKSAVVGS